MDTLSINWGSIDELMDLPIPRTLAGILAVEYILDAEGVPDDEKPLGHLEFFSSHTNASEVSESPEDYRRRLVGTVKDTLREIIESE